MTKLAEVHTLYTRNGRDIPGRLREAAEEIETENDDHDKTVAVLSLHEHESGDIRCFGWGDVSHKDAVFMLVTALARMVVPQEVDDE